MTPQKISIGYFEESDGTFTIVVTVKGLYSERQVKAASDFIENALCGDEFYVQ